MELDLGRFGIVEVGASDFKREFSISSDFIEFICVF